jgi:hypothetical protein
MRRASFTMPVVDALAFARVVSRLPDWALLLEGGAKGIDMHPNGRVLAVTCQNQLLTFFETAQRPA